MEDSIKNQFDAMSQLWKRRIDAYNDRRRNTWTMAISLWGALLFLLYGIFVQSGFLTNQPKNHAQISLTILVVVLGLWGTAIWWLSNNALSMVIERVLANHFEKILQDLTKTEIHPLDRLFFGLYTDHQGRLALSGLWKWLPWTDRSILTITGVICLITCMLVGNQYLDAANLSSDFIWVEAAIVVGFLVITLVFYWITRMSLNRNIKGLNKVGGPVARHEALKSQKQIK